MRVTNQILFQQTQAAIQKSNQRLADLQEAVATGKRINHFGDDPIGAVRALDLRVFEASLDQYGKNINAGLPFLEQTDSVLGDVTEVLGRAKELALQFANDSNNAQDRAIGAAEIQQLFERMVGLANSQIEGRYLFGGFKNGSAPFPPRAPTSEIMVRLRCKQTPPPRSLPICPGTKCSRALASRAALACWIFYTI